LPEQRFFHTSMLTDLSEKTSTLNKIDAIESQMSVQWLKTERLDLSGGGIALILCITFPQTILKLF
jgi:hypothetical protein